MLVISYISFQNTDSYKWDEDMDLDTSDYEGFFFLNRILGSHLIKSKKYTGSFLESAELRRIRRAMGSMNQFINQLQVSFNDVVLLADKIVLTI